MKAIINQFRGLGDIIFVIHIAEYYTSLGYDVIFPVDTKFLNMKKHFNLFEMVSMDDFKLCDLNKRSCNNPNILYIPLRFSSDCIDQSMTMVNKYHMVGLDYNAWRNFSWIRDKKSEFKLYHDVLQLKDHEQYNLINKNSSIKKYEFDVNNGLKNVYLSIYDNFTLLDWAYVVEHAETIHTVGTSLNYLIEIVNLKNDCEYYTYNNDHDYSLYSKIISKPHYRKII